METEHWVQYFTDESTYGSRIPYYYNRSSGETQWEEPEEILYYYYAKHQEKEENNDDSALFTEMFSKDSDSVFKLIGVDSISHLKCDSIRKLHIYHSKTNDVINWDSTALQDNALLLYVISSQFYNVYTCYEELVACASELCTFARTLDVTIPVFFDERLGGVNKFITCIKYITPELTPFISLFDLVVPYLPYNQELVDALQKNITEGSLHCLLCYTRNQIDSFLQSIIHPDDVSSTYMQLLNSTSLNDPFASTLWQLLEEILKKEECFLYASDCMVLIDILIRDIHNYPATNPFVPLFKRLLKRITESDMYTNVLNSYKLDEIHFVL